MSQADITFCKVVKASWTHNEYLKLSLIADLMDDFPLRGSRSGSAGIENR